MNKEKTKKAKADQWLDNLKQLVNKKPLVVFQFSGAEWERLRESRRGANEFTIARSHELFEKVHVPTVCLVIGDGEDDSEVYFGLVSSRSAVTTLESRIKVKRASHIQPATKSGIMNLVTDKTHVRNLKDRLTSDESVIALSPKLSVYIIEKLATIDSNRGAMRAAVASLSAPKYFRNMDAITCPVLSFPSVDTTDKINTQAIRHDSTKNNQRVHKCSRICPISQPRASWAQNAWQLSN